ncbi:hypothetical protein GCM10011321_37670 [Youhaiella tibetensis]|uniref:Divergent polysaccharide deacetylase family protein n=1 Tax=Paradevosia tibetensis TaxID=1447062 RepID=A0A5B9DV17_9HYPH|nr:divergent polysaccharide deacetylase family protein [Youhaiella tibetensis]QEE22288.1 divergent polysaccharide deacetylase family protein [Youhaiella tibetensis]GGF43551.1 hypothetical protein GCM10011321_37670 [Youhaiella tibetensis]
MADELSAPLSRKTDRNRKARALRGNPLHLPLARLGFAVILAILGAVAVRVLVVNDPQGGRPQTTADINASRTGNSVASQVSSPSVVTITADPEETPAGAGGARIISVDPGLPASGSSDPANTPNEFGVIPDLAEETQNGPIPRVSADGRTPFAAYSRASVTPETAGGKPLVALIITGLGLNQAGTLEAIDKLPSAVTMAFAPYGKTLDVTTAAARNSGHELLLQLPLEPFDYPDNDPGPQTLLTGQQPRANIDKLYWLMARLGGYVGVMNYMGARFTSTGADFAPIMEEVGTRGLGYLDDGSSNRSLASQLANANKVPFAKAGMVLDNNPAREPIMAALDALKAQAVEKGSAIGIISALPVSVATVAEWAKTAEDNGVILVPVSALMKR